MNAVTLLKKDHKTVEDLFKRFEKTGSRAFRAKQDVVERIVTELAVHAFIEESVFYPAIRAAADEADVSEVVLEALEEHHIVKWTLSELENMTPDAERYSAKVSVMMESVRHHVEEEEQELFPKVEKLLGAERLEELGTAMAEAKKRAPTHPHPRTPDEPPGNLLAAPAALLLDKARDAGRKLLGTAARETGRKTGAAVSAVSDAVEQAPAQAERAAATAKRTATRTAQKTAQKAPAPAKKATKQTRAATGGTPAKATKAAGTARTAAANAKKTATTGRTTAERQASARKAAATRSSGTRTTRGPAKASGTGR